ncbi:MAG: ADOP family duplicated permease [Longimicrobiales bacterium]
MSGRRPPRLATRIVELLLAPGRSRDGLLGDMEERFHKRAATRPFRAAVGFWGEALGSVGRYAIESARGAPPLFRGLGNDLRISTRSLRRRPALTGLVLGTIALGVGATSAVFSVVNTLLLEPLPFEAQDRLVMADQRDPSTGFRAAVSMPNYDDWRDRSTVFDRFAMEKPETFRVGGDQGMDVLEGRLVLGDFFEAFGVPPVAGRLPTKAELGPGAEAIVVLTEGLWESRFGGDPAAIGATLDIDARPYRVAGVLPAEFTLDSDIALYLPMGLRADDPVWQDRNTSYGGWIVARLKAGATMTDAQADLARVTLDMREAHGLDTAEPALFSMREWYVGDLRTPVLLLMGGVLFVLLIASANVASLLLGRAEERRNDLAIRTAVGASRGQVIRQLMTEAGVLGVTGGVLGLVFAWLGLDALLGTVGSTLPPVFVEKVGLDPLIVGSTLGASLLVAFAFGLAPALYASRRETQVGGKGAAGVGPTSARLRGILVSGEIALSVVLLVCTGLLITSVKNLESADTGFNSAGVLVQRVSVPRARYQTSESRALVQHEIRERVAALPGVVNAASSNLYPLSRTNWEMMFRQPSTWPEERGESVLYTAASADYFDVFSIELLAGRLFGAADGADAPPVVIIDETAAERYWPGEDPIGQLISVDDVREGDEFVPLWRTIVGVAGHVRNYELGRPSRIEAYVPLSQSAACCTTLWLTVRTSGDPSGMASPVRQVINAIDSEIATYRVNTMQSVVDNETAIHRAVERLFGVFGAIALILGAIGITGIVAASVTRRRRDIAVRVALGSAPMSEAASVAVGNLRWVGGGLLAGLVGSSLAGNALRSLLVDVTPFEPAVLAYSLLVLGTVALLAAWVPALAAARLDPVSILKEEG